MRRAGIRLAGPAKRIAVAIAVLVALLAVAVGVAIWRYSEAIAKDQQALGLAQTQFFAQQMRTGVTDEGGVADAYGGDGDRADLADLAQIKANLKQALVSLEQSKGIRSVPAGILTEVRAG